MATIESNTIGQIYTQEWQNYRDTLALIDLLYGNNRPNIIRPDRLVKKKFEWLT